MKTMIAIAGGFAAGVAAAQPCTPSWGETLTAPVGMNNEVRSVAVFDDGSGPAIFAGGHFTQIEGQQISAIARWNGQAWGSVGPGFSIVGAVHWLGTLDDGSGPALYAGGSLTAFIPGAAPTKDIARWDGERWSALGDGLNGTVRAGAVFDDGGGPAIYAAGFAPVGIMKLHDGAWTPLGQGLRETGGATGSGYALGVYDLGDGPRLYVGGRFDTAGAVTSRGVAAWDGTTWHALDGLPGDLARAQALTTFDDGAGLRLYAGGQFATGAAAPIVARVARWTGAQWQPIGSELPQVHSLYYVSSLAVLNGQLYAGGVFGSGVWPNQSNYLVRLSGDQWTTVDGGMSDWVRGLTVVNEGPSQALYAAGAFKVAGTTIANRVARWDGAEWTSLEKYTGLSNTGLSGSSLTAGIAHVMQPFDAGNGEQLVVGGSFSGAGGKVANGIASWDGDTWHRLGSGVTGVSGQPGQIQALTVREEAGSQTMYAGGSFAFAGGGPAPSIARWDGTSWSSLGGSGTNGEVRALAFFGSDLFAGGVFTQAGPVTVSRIARWDGVEWHALGTGLAPYVASSGGSSTSSIDSLAVFDNGAGPALYAGGSFDSISGVAARSLARWDGSSWSSVGDILYAMGPSYSGAVSAMAVYNDGFGPNLYVAGRFSFAAGVPAKNIARLGASWRAVAPALPAAPTQPITSLAVFNERSGPCLYAASDVGPTTYSLSPTGLHRWNGSRWFHPGAGSSWPAPAGSGRVHAVGTLKTGDTATLCASADLIPPTGGYVGAITQWQACPPCPADCNHDGQLLADDFACFLADFQLMGGYADCTGDQALIIADLACFQARFAAGCP